ncbi:uncharacterized protein LOC119555130 [Drosophila subpulchrella]|uniref:uncharacterized protein LOC119555130 n=1 Tax=Drosophila subpulchrella TaxID=1486046 RepID=UPI0018A13F5C|nr:uncharacterized protein LOC119555130 [Drosophila subpulchrella]
MAKPINFKEMPSEMPPAKRIKLEGEVTVAEAINFLKTQCDTRKEHKPEDALQEGPTVADELNARLAMVHVREARAKRIRRLVKYPTNETQALYRFICVCPRYHPCYVPCQHTGQIIIDRDVLSREEHICFLATPKKDFSSPQLAKQSRYYTKKIFVNQCTARVERLADPHPMRVSDTYNFFKEYLSPRHIAALENQMKPKPPVEAMSMEKALEYMEEEMRQRRAAKRVHKRRCKGLKKRILLRQRKQMQKIICVLFEEMKDFLLNDQFIVDENSPLCCVILERLREFTDQEFYTTSNLREYQRILANNLTVWINKFISNLNIYLAPQQIPVQRQMMAENDPEQFVPLSDFISVSDEPGAEEMMEDVEHGAAEYDYGYGEDYLPDVLNTDLSEETIIN